MILRHHLLLTATAVTVLWAQAATAQSNPFAPGGALQPWQGPLPRENLVAIANTPPHPARFQETSPQSDYQAPQGARSFSSFPAPIDADSASRGPESSRSYVAVLFNPILSPLGKTSARMEVAPLPAHALFIEGSKISINVPDLDRTVSGWAVDFGYHFFPMGNGLNGFYLGPRYSTGKGDTADASGQYTGWGGDLGYQFVIADHLAINLGIGAIYINGSAGAKDSAIAGYVPAGTDPSAYGIDTQQRISKQMLLPVATLAIGFAL